MAKFAAILSYRGTKYCGFQRQGGAANGTKASIQETLENALFEMTQEKQSVVSSGRTDAGVHAVGQVIHFKLEKKTWKTTTLKMGLNAQLPKSIRLIDVREVPESFHAQRSAIQKQYSYYFQQGPVSLVHLEPFSWWNHKKLDVAVMQAAVNALVGEHDFKPFQASGSQELKTTVRTVFGAQVTREKIEFPDSLEAFDLIRLRIVGSGFLKQMVRGIAGTLFWVGEGSKSPEIFTQILDSQDRSLLGPTAPGRGLWLEKVWYDPDPFS